MAALLLGSSGLMATPPAYTAPSGFVTINITPAAVAGETSATAFSVSLRKAKKNVSQATSVSGHAVSVAGAAWTPDTEWGDPAHPHILYIGAPTATEEDDPSKMAYEAFLIEGNTADTITVVADSGFNLQDSFLQTAKFFIVEATTIGELFGATSDDVKFLKGGTATDSDNIYLWDGNAWEIYWFNGNNWTGDGFSNANDTIVFPDDGIFVIRRGTEGLPLVFTGSVPEDNQLTNIVTGSTFVGSKYPVDTKIKDMGFLSLSGWATGGTATDSDNVYVWSGTAWLIYWHNGSNWTKDGFSDNNEDIIVGNSAMFIIKKSAGGSSSESSIPYDLEKED